MRKRANASLARSFDGPLRPQSADPTAPLDCQRAAALRAGAPSEARCVDAAGPGVRGADLEWTVYGPVVERSYTTVGRTTYGRRTPRGTASSKIHIRKVSGIKTPNPRSRDLADIEHYSMYLHAHFAVLQNLACVYYVDERANKPAMSASSFSHRERIRRGASRIPSPHNVARKSKRQERAVKLLG